MGASRLRRSVHFVPAGNEKLLNKSLGLAADSLILDLEDAVGADQKDSARENVKRWLEERDFGAQERVVRINPLDTPWGLRDLEGTMGRGPDGYLIPKVRNTDELFEIDRCVSRLEGECNRAPGSVRLLVLGTETPEGLLNVRELPCAPRVDVLTWGAEDLAAAIGARRNRDEAGQYLEVFRYARVMTLLAAAAAGVQPVDTVYINIPDLEGLRRECLESAWMGFTGKLTIHPDQIPIVNEVFTPSKEEIVESRELIAAFEKSQAQGEAVFRFRGQMVDAPHLARARNILERAELAGAC